ncbi:MAG TPA: thioredoxin family protein [Thermoanaerobaculia bacterium]|nr:thioredoxin family protein [Thermoanaerobaculia bacterium]
MKRTAITAMLLLIATFVFAAEVEVGAKAPGFTLANAVNGANVAFKPGDGKLSVVVFTCNQCPYAKAFEQRIVDLGRDYAKRGVVFYAIDSNDEAQYSIESASEMKSRATEQHYPFPYLKDGDSRIARAYGARVTPHIFVVDGTGTVRYRGYVDDSAKTSERKHEGLRDALDSLLAGKAVDVTATRAFGCTIKFKS